MSIHKPKILFVCPCWPVDTVSGGQLRALHIGRALKQIGNVDLIVVNADPLAADAVERTKEEFNLIDDIKGRPVPATKLTDKLKWAFDPRHKNVHGYLATDSERMRMDQAAERADIVWFLKLRGANVLNRWSWPRSVMDIDDVPSTFARSQFVNAANLRGRVSAITRIRILKRRERLLQERFSVLTVCSTSDRDHLGFQDRVHVIPNGFECPSESAVRCAANPPRIGFIGLYSYAPNHEGVRWFVDNCWERLKARIPGIRLRLIGTDSNGPLKPADPAIDGLGWIKDPGPEIATWSLMIVPIRTGAGTRIKIADAFSRKCPVVSTSFGAFGYNLAQGSQICLADTPDDFSAACIDLINNSAKATALAEVAWKEFLDKWTWQAITPKVWKAAEEVLKT